MIMHADCLSPTFSRTKWQRVLFFPAKKTPSLPPNLPNRQFSPHGTPIDQTLPEPLPQTAATTTNNELQNNLIQEYGKNHRH
jgi:hypothetical protein